MMKKKPPKEIPQCDQDLIALYLENSVRCIVPLIEGEFLSEFETAFMVDNTVYSLKLEKKPTPKQFTRKAVITIALHLSIAFIIVGLTAVAIKKTPLWFHALFGIMATATAIYIINLLVQFFKIPFLIKYRP